MGTGRAVARPRRRQRGTHETEQRNRGRSPRRSLRASRFATHAAFRARVPDRSVAIRATRLGPRAVMATATRQLTTRRDLLAHANGIIQAAMAHGAPGNSHVFFEGSVGGYGKRIDGLEAFARTFLLAGFILKGSSGEVGREAADWFAKGIATGTNPASPERWTRLDEHPQAKVEAASIALILDMTRPWIWDEFSDETRQHVIDYLSPAVGDQTYPRINWVWFRLVVETFLKSVGGPFSAEDMRADLNTHDTFARAGGWLADGDERSFDHYNGWALHLYPTLWAQMQGAEEMASKRGTVDRDRLDRYLTDALALVGADGSPLLQGRSLTYRFATAAPFWIGAMASVPSHRPGALRHAALAIIDHFAAHGAPDSGGLLTVGWYHRWPALAQAYSGPGSPYWACKGMLGLALNAEHPAWTDADVPLPVEQGDVLREIEAPGWIVSGTRSDGIVRVINHGTDHARPDDRRADSPLYARLGYSTSTSPLLDKRSWQSPLDQTVCLVDAHGVATHHSGMHVRELRVDGTGREAVGVAVSESRMRWVDVDAVQEHHGSGFTGRVVDAGSLTVVSLVRGAFEVRLARASELTETAHERSVGLRIAGWPLADDAPIGASVVEDGRPTAMANTDRLASRVYASTPTAKPSISQIFDASPLGRTTVVPWILERVREGSWVTAMVELSGAGVGDVSAPSLPPVASFDADVQGNEVSVTWPDGARTVTRLAHSFPNPRSDGIGE